MSVVDCMARTRKGRRCHRLARYWVVGELGHRAICSWHVNRYPWSGMTRDREVLG